MSGQRHRPTLEPSVIAVAVLTASDTRTLEDDESGHQACALLAAAGHPVLAHRVVPDEPAAIREAIASAEEDPAIRMILLLGGTGIAPRDRTFETVGGLIERPLPGFGELFRTLSYREVGSAAMLSRATAGVRGRRALFSVPGSPAAVRLALEELILPQIAHLIGLLDQADG